MWTFHSESWQFSNENRRLLDLRMPYSDDWGLRRALTYAALSCSGSVGTDGRGITESSSVGPSDRVQNWCSRYVPDSATSRLSATKNCIRPPLLEVALAPNGRGQIPV